MIMQIDFIPFFIHALYPIVFGFVHNKVGDFLFGSTTDPGKKSRQGLEDFGFGRGELFEGLSEQDQLLGQFLGAQGRQSAAARSARSGFTGTGLGEDIQNDANLRQADFIQRLRFGLISNRIKALGGLAGLPIQKDPGLVQGATQAFSAALGSSIGGG
jgi:hypothetical protein